MHKPDANRLRRNLSGIINFAKFREEKLAPYTDMQEAAEHLLEETAQLEEQQLQLVGGWLDVLLEAVLLAELHLLWTRLQAKARLACQQCLRGAAWQIGWQGCSVAVLLSSSGAVAWHAMSAAYISPRSCLNEECCVCLQQAELQRLREEREAQQPVGLRTACMCSVWLAAILDTFCHSAAWLSLT